MGLRRCWGEPTCFYPFCRTAWAGSPGHACPSPRQQVYLLLLFIRVLLSWFPTFTWWDQQPWLALRQVTDPYLKLFSGLVPPLLGTIDLTPLVGFFILQVRRGGLGGLGAWPGCMAWGTCPEVARGVPSQADLALSHRGTARLLPARTLWQFLAGFLLHVDEGDRYW